VGLPSPKLWFDTVIVRFGGEIGIKAAWTRKLYERRLIANIKAALKHHSISYAQFVRKFGRLYIKTCQPEEAAVELSRVLGIASASQAAETTSDLNNIANVSLKLAESRLDKEQSLAVRCHRVGEHPYTSQKVCSQVGETLLAKLSNLKVFIDLNHPDLKLNIEVREDKAYVFTDIIKAVGGLPVGTQPKLVCLLKGDTSSAVACWMTMKRGCPPILVNFREDADAETNLKRALGASQKLLEWAIGFPRRLYVVELKRESRLAMERHPSELRSLLRRRFMLRAARHLAQRWGAEGIVTGDSIRKGAFQSLHAFRIEDEAAGDYPVYRPVLGLDSQEIAETASRIGFEVTTSQKISEKPVAEMAGEGGIDLDDVKRIEEEVGIETMVEASLKSMKALKV